MLTRLEARFKPELADSFGLKIADKIRHELRLPVAGVRVVKALSLQGVDAAEARTLVEATALHDPVLQEASLSPLGEAAHFDWAVEVGFRPGVTDNEGRTATEITGMVLGKAGVRAYSSQVYLITGALSRTDIERVAKDLLANDLIQRTQIKSSAEWKASPGFAPLSAQVSVTGSDTVETVALSGLSDAELAELSSKRVLALSVSEMKAIRAYYQDPGVALARKKAGLPAEPLDAELECLAQTWSEHCKHKIFAADIDYACQGQAGRSYRSLYKTMIQNVTAGIRKELGPDDPCLSVFSDNAGVMRFTEEQNVCVKVETHNSPSALDPYGGALTGIVGVNRDPMGTGLGADMLCNTDVFCFASPFHDEPLPPRLLHPRRVLDGVGEGVEHGGNKSGIPTVNGSIVFHERFLGKPLVFCGTIGTMKTSVAGRLSHEKAARPGDRIVMTGGRIGADGIHGATFSSEELHEGSPATAVQIGDPITQKRMYDFLRRCRDRGLYSAITDNGAGGLSSSVGEMAEQSGGCDLDLARAPLKYPGLRPWEILLSEAQERMTLAVPPERIDEVLSLAAEMGVEATDLGEFTDTGLFYVRHGQNVAASLDMAFLHDGCPRMSLRAVWPKELNPAREPQKDLGDIDHGPLLHKMLGRLNIASKEWLIRQYDHEVKGKSVIKPLVGVKRDGPADAAVLRVNLARPECLVVSHGICPKFSDLDAYWMAASAVDEALRNAVAVGADPDRCVGVDNFCWCDPVQSEKTPDGEYKLAQLVRANQALAHFCGLYRVPCVSGKDSMKNDYTGAGTKISIPPTLLFTLLGRLDAPELAVSSDAKAVGDAVYLLGATSAELGGGELADELGLTGGNVPQVDAVSAQARYRSLHKAIKSGFVAACHDLSDGGLAVAAAEMALAGRLGLRLDLDAVPAVGALDAATLLYSESQSRLLVEVKAGCEKDFAALFEGQPMARVGEIVDGGRLEVLCCGQTILDEEVEAMATSFRSTLAF